MCAGYLNHMVAATATYLLKMHMHRLIYTHLMFKNVEITVCIIFPVIEYQLRPTRGSLAVAILTSARAGSLNHNAATAICDPILKVAHKIANFKWNINISGWAASEPVTIDLKPLKIHICFVGSTGIGSGSTRWFKDLSQISFQMVNNFQNRSTNVIDSGSVLILRLIIVLSVEVLNRFKDRAQKNRCFNLK